MNDTPDNNANESLSAKPDTAATNSVTFKGALSGTFKGDVALKLQDYPGMPDLSKYTVRNSKGYFVSPDQPLSREEGEISLSATEKSGGG